MKPFGDNTGNGHTGGGAGSSNIGGGNNSGSSNNGSGSSTNNSGNSNIPSGPSSQTLNSSTTKLIIAKGANYLSNYTKNLLLNLEGYSGTIKITNTSRTPEKQAQIMYDAILRTGKDYQYKTYKAPGRRVIDVYDPNKSREGNIINMTKQIYKEGPINVSRHCADFNELNTLDISRTYSTNLSALYSSLKKLLEKGLLRGLLNETENSCIHVEIWQK